MKRTFPTAGTAVFAAMMLSAEPVDVKKLDQSAKAATANSERANIFEAKSLLQESRSKYCVGGYGLH